MLKVPFPSSFLAKPLKTYIYIYLQYSQYFIELKTAPFTFLSFRADFTANQRGGAEQEAANGRSPGRSSAAAAAEHGPPCMTAFSVTEQVQASY